MSKTHTAPWDYERKAEVAKFNTTCPKCLAPCYDGAIPDGGRSYTCENCGSFSLTEEQVAWVRLYDENPQGCENANWLNATRAEYPTASDEELADLQAWLDDGFNLADDVTDEAFNDPAAVAEKEEMTSNAARDIIDELPPL